jgi:hypothetical protein
VSRWSPSTVSRESLVAVDGQSVSRWSPSTVNRDASPPVRPTRE